MPSEQLLILAHDQLAIPFSEALDIRECPLPYNRTIHSETFASCQTTVELAESRSIWLFGAGCFGGVCIVLLSEFLLKLFML